MKLSLDAVRICLLQKELFFWVFSWLIVQHEVHHSMSKLLQSDWIDLRKASTTFAFEHVLVTNLCFIQILIWNPKFNTSFESFGELSEIILYQEGFNLSSCFLIMVYLSPEDSTVQYLMDL